jgi:hypothetical protein
MIDSGFAAEQGHAPDPESLRLSVLVIPPFAPPATARMHTHLRK